MQPVKRIVPLAAFLSICIGIATPARASILYSTDGTATPGFNSAGGYGSYNGSNSTAAQFVATASGVLDHIEVPSSSVGHGTFNETVELRADNAGLPGSVIDSFTITVTDSAALVAGVSVSHPTLSAGQTYWLENTEPSGPEVGWYLSSPAVSGKVLAGVTGDTSWESTCPQCNGDLPAFALIAQDATTTPEPTTAVLSLTGIGGTLVFSKRLRRSSLRVGSKRSL